MREQGSETSMLDSGTGGCLLKRAGGECSGSSGSSGSGSGGGGSSSGSGSGGGGSAWALG